MDSTLHKGSPAISEFYQTSTEGWSLQGFSSYDRKNLTETDREQTDGAGKGHFYFDGMARETGCRNEKYDRTNPAKSPFRFRSRVNLMCNAGQAKSLDHF